MAKTAAKITTDRQVSGLKPREGAPYETSIAGVRGLSVRVFPSGTKAWEFRYVAKGGARRRMPLGEYPGLTLAKATEKAEALRVSVVQGHDPAEERLAERHRARTGDTLEELAEAYFEAAKKGLHGGRKRPKRASSIAVETTRFNLHIKPRLGDKRFAQIKRQDVKVFMRELATGSMAADSVASVGRTLSAILAFAVHEERLEANPAAGLTQPLALNPRARMFDDKAVKALWAALPTETGADGKRAIKKPSAPDSEEKAVKLTVVEPVTAMALRFALLTLTRRADVAGAEWGEFDFNAAIWTIPGNRHKSRRPHVVPLSEEAVKLLRLAAKLGGDTGAKPEDLRSGFVFPSSVLADRHITEHGLTRALARICGDLKIPRGSPHDFRRVGATHLTSERLGFRRFVVSKVLGHAAQDGATVTEVYDRNEYLSDKRRALDAWADLLMEIVGERKRADNVKPIHGAAA